MSPRTTANAGRIKRPSQHAFSLSIAQPVTDTEFQNVHVCSNETPGPNPTRATPFLKWIIGLLFLISASAAAIAASIRSPSWVIS